MREADKKASDSGIDNRVIRYDQQIGDIMRRQFASIEQQIAKRGVHVDLLLGIDNALLESHCQGGQADRIRSDGHDNPWTAGRVVAHGHSGSGGLIIANDAGGCPRRLARPFLIGIKAHPSRGRTILPTRPAARHPRKGDP